MRTSLALVLLPLVLLVAGPAAAQLSAGPVTALAQVTRPRSVADCEQVKGDLAYNQCLSMFGPAAHTKAGSGDGATAGAAAAPVPEEAVAPTRRGRRGRAVRRGGRQSASFTVGHRGGHHGGRRRRR